MITVSAFVQILARDCQTGSRLEVEDAQALLDFFVKHLGSSPTPQLIALTQLSDALITVPMHPNVRATLDTSIANWKDWLAIGDEG